MNILHRTEETKQNSFMLGNGHDSLPGVGTMHWIGVRSSLLNLLNLVFRFAVTMVTLNIP